MHPDTFDHLHILMNYEWDSRALLSLVLVGLPELSKRLQLRKSRSLYSRLHHRVEIGAMTPEDTNAYLAHRLKNAGTDREIFTSDAMAMLHEAARTASLRDVDRIASDSLKLAARRKKRLVERDVIAAVMDEPEKDG